MLIADVRALPLASNSALSNDTAATWSLSFLIRTVASAAPLSVLVSSMGLEAAKSTAADVAAVPDAESFRGVVPGTRAFSVVRPPSAKYDEPCRSRHYAGHSSSCSSRGRTRITRVAPST